MAETISDRIKQRVQALKLSIRGLAAQAGLPESTIRNILEGTSGNPRSDTIAKLAAAIQVSEQWLLTGTEAAAAPIIAPAVIPSSAPQLPTDVRVADVTIPQFPTLPKDMPVLGTAAGSELDRGAFQLTPDVVDYVRRPPGLLGAKGAYALYVEGDSMSPRFEPGDLVFVHPHRKALGGDYVIVQEPHAENDSPRAFIKRLVRVTGTTLRVEQFNPPTTIDFVLRPGLVWHKVMTDADLYTF